MNGREGRVREWTERTWNKQEGREGRGVSEGQEERRKEIITNERWTTTLF